MRRHTLSATKIGSPLADLADPDSGVFFDTEWRSPAGE